MMDRDLQNKLIEGRSLLLHEAANRLTDGTSADFAADLERLDLYDKLLATAQVSRWRKLIAPGVVGAVCLAIISIGWSFHLPMTHVTLAVDTEFASLGFSAPWNWPAALPLKSEPVRLTNFSTIELPSTNQQIVRLNGKPWAEIGGGKASLSRLSFGRDGILTLERGDDGRLSLFGRGAKFSGELAIWGNPTLSAGPDIDKTEFAGPVELPDADTVSFSAEGQGAVPAHLELLPQQTTILANLRVNKLSFAREVPDQLGGIAFASAVVGGKLSFDDLGTQIAMDSGDRLTLADVDGVVREIRVGDKITVTFAGRVGQVTVGAEDKTPNLIEYVYHGQRFAFFWAAAASIGGMLWSVRRYLSS
jgi:hypothetical protein